MGQAKINAKRNTAEAKKLELVDLPLLSKLIQKYASKYHADHGKDCIYIATEAAAVLNALGIRAHMDAGWASWRVNDTETPVLGCHPSYLLTVAGNFRGHCWTKVGNQCIDFTGYQLRLRAQTAEDSDGIPTPVEFDVPDYFEFRAGSTIDHHSLQDNGETGQYSYKSDKDVLSHANSPKALLGDDTNGRNIEDRTLAIIDNIIHDYCDVHGYEKVGDS